MLLSVAAAVAATGCGSTTSSPGGAAGVAEHTFTVTVQNGQESPSLRIRGGRVYSEDGRIDCGVEAPQQRCSAEFPAESVVVLRAAATGIDFAVSPPRPYLFMGWAGDCAGEAYCTLGGPADRYVVAIFSGEQTSHSNYSLPSVHGPAWAAYEAGSPGALDCRSCHGQNLQGVGIAIACDRCHAWPRSEPRPPFVFVTSPLDGSTVSGIADVQISAVDDQGIADVQLYVDGSATGAQFIELLEGFFVTDFPFGLLPEGPHGLLACAWDVTGLGACSPSVNVTVRHPVVAHAISGRVSGVATDGVAIELGGASAATTHTDPTGWYVFSSLPSGVYTVTPSLPGHVFSPPSATVTVDGGDAVGVDFVASLAAPPDTGSWTSQASGTTRLLTGVAWSGTRLVAVGFEGAVVSSADGSTWEPASPPCPGGDYYMDVAFGGGLFVAVGTNAYGTHFGGIVSTSPDGIRWTPRTSASAPALNAVAFGNGTFVAVGNLGSIQTSPDGVQWTAVSSGTSNHLNGATFTGTGFVAVGHEGTVLTSPDGSAWSALSAGAQYQLHDIVHGGGLFVATGQPMAGGASTVLTSTDLTSWTDRSPTCGGGGIVKRITHGDGTFVMVGADGLLIATDFSFPCTIVLHVNMLALSDVVWTGTRFVAVGAGGVIFTSDRRGTWQTRAPLPLPDSRHGMVVAGGRLYALGGLNPTTHVYDPVADAWAARSWRGVRRSGFGAIEVGGIIYVIGGELNLVPSSAVEAYDPTTDTWSTRAPMPTARSQCGAAVVDGVIYVVGGGAQGGVLDTLEAYDPSTDSWSTRAPMPTARWFHSAATAGGLLYAIGGGTGVGASVEVYDPATDSWSIRAPLPTPRHFLATAVVGSSIYAIGGESEDNWDYATGTWRTDALLTSVEVYDPGTDTWSERAPMPTARASSAAAALDGVVYVSGGDHGNAGGSFFSTVEAFTP